MTPLRIGTWNLDRCRASGKGVDHVAFMRDAGVDLWLLTEVPRSLPVREASAVFGQQRLDERDQCWSAIVSETFPLRPEEAIHFALTLAQFDLGGREVLAAASVLPWRAARGSWPAGHDADFTDRFRDCLGSHALSIHVCRACGPAIWGGDFNQALSGREYVGTRRGRAELLEVFELLDLTPHTAEARGRRAPARSIDHIALPNDWKAEPAEVHRPTVRGRELSDHPAYVVTVTDEESAIVLTA